MCIRDRAYAGTGVEPKIEVTNNAFKITLPNRNAVKDVYKRQVMKLPEKQAKRIYARYYLGMAVNEIAEVEGVDPSRVRDSIRRGLKQLGKYF